jgi:peptide methionine sulfoxide reductase msrA/msrB
MNQQAEIYFAGGCFWGTEHFMKLIKGVESTQVGYANSIVANPSYEEVCTGNTHAAETVKVVYNPSEVHLSQLIELFFRTIDPTTLNRQGGDIGTQYRTGIYYMNEGLMPIIDNEIAKLAAKYTSPIVVEVMPLENFFPAEAYHQHYLDKNPGGYCHIDPELFRLAKQTNR